MNRTDLIAVDVAVLAGDRLHVSVTRPAPLDLQFAYRAALAIYWNEADHRLEDRCTWETTVEDSALRIARTMSEEYGLRLVPSPEIAWSGLDDAARIAVHGVLFGERA